MDPMISVVIPTYNEKDNIERLIREVAQTLDQLPPDGEIIVVDDDSPDGTADEVRRMAGDWPVRVVVRTQERGLATAVMRGFDEARGDVIAVMDADLSHRPEDLARLWRALEENGADMVIGSRHVAGGGAEDWSRVRGFISWVARMMSRGLCPIKDSTSGFFMFRKSIIDQIHLNPVGYKIGLEIAVKSRTRKIVEAPILFRDRTHGQSKLDWRVTADYFKHLLALYWWILFRASAKVDVGPTLTFARFCLVGFSGVAVNYGLFALFRHGFGVDHLIAGAVAIEISILSNFALNNFWTWRSRHQGWAGLGARLVKYHLVAGLAAFGGNWGTLYLLADVVGLQVDLSYIIGIGVGILINFFLNDRWTFARTLWEPET
jgi:dolichol-phosphate mannosyltransferase